MSYRVELSKTRTAGCQATHCKKEGTKIAKGELRQGTLVTIQEHTSMRWRHWGCVTPQVLKNWKETCDMDMEMVDGYEELPPEAQEKVKRALEQCHVDDEDWNGDVEMNRFNPDKKNQGMFKKTPKKQAKEDSDGEPEASPTKQPAKKRGRAKQEEEVDEEEPAPKKAKSKTKKAAPIEEAEPEQAPPAKKAKKGKKASEEVIDAPRPKPVAAAKKGKGKKAKSAETVELDEDMPSLVEDAPPKKASKSKKGTAKAVVAADDDQDAPKSKPQKRRGKKASASAED